MSELKYLHKHNHGHDVHESCVKLKIFLSRTNMVAGTQNTLKYEGKSHGIKDAKVVWDSFTRLFYSFVLHCLFVVLPGLVFCQHQEHQTKPDVTDVAKEMIKVS